MLYSAGHSSKFVLVNWLQAKISTASRGYQLRRVGIDTTVLTAEQINEVWLQRRAEEQARAAAESAQRKALAQAVQIPIQS